MNSPMKLPTVPALNRKEAHDLIQQGSPMFRKQGKWWIGSRLVHGNAARVILSSGVRSGTLQHVKDVGWMPKEGTGKSYCQRLADHIHDNNIPAALTMLADLDAEVIRLGSLNPKYR